jgi:nitrate reductase molybdenum cofactor assembly chaperone NarJ/NarW
MEIYNELADLLEYPGPDFQLRLSRCVHLLNSDYSEPLEPLREFCKTMIGIPVSEAQEVYTRTFDLNPVCALEIGYHLFGENYKRGLFLAQLSEMEERLYLAQGGQLPDYLPLLLRLIGRIGEEELRGELIAECIVPALGKMIDAASGADSTYRYLLEAVRAAMELETRDFSSSQQGASDLRSFYV